MELKQKTISGVAWNSGGQLATQAVQFGIMVTLIRLLTPEAFGHLAMAMVFVGFAQIFNDLGFGAALVQGRDVRASHVSSVFWVNVFLGGVLCGIFYAAAPYVAAFYGEPSVGEVVKVLGGVFVVAAPGVVPRALLQRAMTFRTLAAIDVVSVIGAGALAVGMALAGWGVWSLVAQVLARRALASAGALALVQQRPQLHFSLSSVRDVLGFSAGYSGFRFINYWARKSDDLLIGKFMGSAGLGVYDRAYRVMLFPIRRIISVISKVMFPALSSIQDDRARVRRIYLRTVGLLALVIFPMMLGLFAVADAFVLALFGERWAEAIPIIKILCFAALTQTLSNPTGWIYTSQGRTDWMFWWGVFGSGTLVVSIVVGVMLGTLQSVALAYLVANVVLLYPSVAIPGRLIDMRAAEVARAVAGPLACSVLMATLVWMGAQLLSPAWGAGPRLALLLPGGAACYVGLILWLRPVAYHTACELVVEQWNRRTPLS